MIPHVPVLLDEVLTLLAIRADGLYVDATFGRGGHSRGILQKLGSAGRLLAMDRDPDAVAAGRALQADDPRFFVFHERFGRLASVLRAEGVHGQVDGLLLDIGVSSPQFDDPDRGFGFRADGPLDMRMDPGSGEPASAWLNAATEAGIAEVLWRFGEERAARRIARAICTARTERPITRTLELARIIEGVVRREPGRHPATRSFQAMRIFINAELDELGAALEQAHDALKLGGRLCIISFHSLEDRIVKRFLRDRSRIDPALRSVPQVPDSALPTLKILTQAVRPGADELVRNPRARSAVLRAAERVR